MRRSPHALVLAAALVALDATPASHAQPAPAPTATDPGARTDKTDAKALLQSGLKLFGAKDYLGALAVFRNAYERFPSTKLLLNIATTLTRLDRKAEAANTYQRYLDAADADPRKRAEVAKTLATLDRDVGVVVVSIAPRDAELQVGDGEWLGASATPRLRVAPGSVVVRARRDGHEPRVQTVRVGAGEQIALTLALVVSPVRSTSDATGDAAGVGVVATGSRAPARSRIGALALAHIDVTYSGVAALVGVTADVTRRLQVQAMGLVGSNPGGYVGASVAVLDGRYRPFVAAGLPVFFSDGPRVGVRGAGGIEVALNRHLALIAEVGVSHVLNPQATVSATSFVPALGAAGRL